MRDSLGAALCAALGDTVPLPVREREGVAESQPLLARALAEVLAAGEFESVGVGERLGVREGVRETL